MPSQIGHIFKMAAKQLTLGQNVTAYRSKAITLGIQKFKTDVNPTTRSQDITDLTLYIMINVKSNRSYFQNGGQAVNFRTKGDRVLSIKGHHFRYTEIQNRCKF